MRRLAPIGLLLLGGAMLSGCAGSPSPTAEVTQSAEGTSTESPSESPSPSTTAAAGSGAAAAAPSACRADQRPTGRQYVVWNIPQNDPDGGLVAHQLAGASTDEIDVLPPGTTVDTDSRVASCRVVADGGVWWEIGTPLLATGGWVNAHFLVAVESVPVDDRQDFPTEASAQVACVYEKELTACQLLESLGYPKRTNYGLGNSYSQAPSAALQDQCTAGDILACAELRTR